MMFTFFRKPISNTKPYRDITLEQLFTVIEGNYYKAVTKELREALNRSENEYKALKSTTLDYITIGGTFSQRGDKNLIKASGYMMLDLDHIRNPAKQKELLIKKEMPYDIQMIFISPSGEGLKIVVTNPEPDKPYSETYQKIRDYFFKELALDLDKTSDISRACFLCHDKDVWMQGQKTKEEQTLDDMTIKNPALDQLIKSLDLVVDDSWISKDLGDCPY